MPWDARSGASVADFDGIAPTNDYTMDEELGVGGFGTVFKGTSKTSKSRSAGVPRGRFSCVEASWQSR